ncbi:hypothetical protein KDX14_33065 [Burkholderia cenocepacia]|uniref:hypothetical protein n=1 Tax=Burkholderia cenocepacia TaxID=95486 RepID=UPI001B989018|nr:hypothetical protein [Burkholderia cenocepacia]MBR8074357.1 hypothetical protein [Burkholderia cenocepacia]
MGLFNLGSLNLAGALGAAPTGLFSGLDPSASMGTVGGAPLGGGIAGQIAGMNQVSGPAAMSNPAIASMLMSQVLGGIGGATQGQRPQPAQFGDYAQPQTPLTAGTPMPAMNAQIGRMLMGGA